MSFLEYERKFNELPKIGPSLIDTPLKKNEKFIVDAHLEYYNRLTAHVHGTFTSLIDRALRYENSSSKEASVVPSTTPSAASNNSKKRRSNF